MNDESNPYYVLGLSPNDSIEKIEKVYKEFMLVLHPDKYTTAESIKLNMSNESKYAYYEAVRRAYKSIMNTKKESKYPDYKIGYETNGEYKININKEFKESGSIDSKKFNALFEQAHNADKKAGFDSPYNRGYGSEFDASKNFNSTATVGSVQYSDDISIQKPSKLHVPQIKSDGLVEYISDFGVFNTGNYQELGITHVSDFSMSTVGKGSLGGTDLMTIYGQNFENWEDTVKRDEKLYTKYNDSTSIISKASKMKDMRGIIYDLPLDKDMLIEETKRNIELGVIEDKRQKNKNKQDKYYNELNKGLLN